MKQYGNALLDMGYNFAVGAILGLIFLMPFGINPFYGGFGTLTISLALTAYTLFTGRYAMPKWVMFAGLLKEIWISRLMEKFYPEAAWLQRSQDFSGMVENNTINLAEIGADPAVLVNNTSYPVPFADRTDVPLQLPLDYYDTQGTVVRNAEAIQLAYPKMDSVISQHGKALAKKQSGKAAWNYAPASNTALTPVLPTSGATVNGRKTYSFQDIIAAAQSLDALDAPQEGRVLVLSTIHKQDLLNQDVNLFKSFTNLGNGMIGKLYNFDIYVSTQTPTYNSTTSAKNAYGAAAAGTDINSSFFFLETEVMRAKGTMDMFSRLRDPEARGDIVGFQQRFLALPIRNKYIGATIG
jgi:hypothetical protein